MEGASMLTGMVLLLTGGILLPTPEKNLGIIFMTCFWVPYGAYWYIRRVSGPPPSHPKRPTAPVLEAPLPIAVVVDEDPAPAS
jgi:hypothetical protein